MVLFSRIAMILAAVLMFSALPATAQQAGSSAAATPPVASGTAVATPSPGASIATGAASGPMVFTAEQLLAIAGGAVVGAFAADLVLHGGLATAAGALLGGYVGHWFYTQPPSAAPGAG